MDNIFWTDSHAHIHNDEYGRSVEEIMAEAAAFNVKRVVTIGTDYLSSVNAAMEAEHYDNLYAAVGIHPESALEYTNEYYDKFYQLASQKKVTAVGETGLDFYYENNPSEEKQIEVFEAMIDIACSLNKPVVIHSRNAALKTIEVLEKAYNKYNNLKGIFHCFDGSLDVLDWVTDKNFYISYAGNVTFKSAENLRNALVKTPLDKLLIETDSPYLSPVPVRGRPNKPANTRYTGEFISQYININKNELSKILEANFIRIMGV